VYKSILRGKSKIRILFIQHYGWEFGGGESYSSDLKKELAKSGHEVKILSSSNNPNVRHFSDYEFKVMNNRMLKPFSNLFNFRSYSKLKKVLKEFTPDIVHIQSIDEEVTPSILCCLNDLPKILTLHGPYLQKPLGFNVKRHEKNSCEIIYANQCARCMGLPNYIHAIVKLFVWGLFLPKIDLFITPSNYFKSLHKNIISNIKVLPNGIKLKNFNKMVNFNNILYIGRLDRRKGVSYLIDAVPIILSQIPNISLKIIGDGPEWEYLNKKVRNLGLNKEILFLGKIEHKEVWKHISKAKIIIMPSICPESFGLVGIEAMSVSRPVIASRVGGIPEWLDDDKTGFLVDPGNVNQIAEKVIQLLSDRNLLEQMGKNAYKKAEQLSIEKHAHEIEKIYMELIEKYKTKEARNKK
jgi:glycosyltransferase involved in cell wall biosynthesis